MHKLLLTFRCFISWLTPATSVTYTKMAATNGCFLEVADLMVDAGHFRHV